MLKAIALDDEEPALEVIEAFCNRIDRVDLRKTFTRTDDAQAYLKEFTVDLLFLDINMPSQSGVEFYRMMAQQRETASLMVIFTTAHSDYAVESYSLNAVDYLLKPFTFERFQQATQKAYEQWIRQFDENGQAYVLFRVEYGMVTVKLDDILFVEGLDNYLKIHLMNQKPLIVRLTMKAMVDKLPSRRFVRVHRSYIVALAKIKLVRSKLIHIDEAQIPLSNMYEPPFYALFQGA